MFTTFDFSQATSDVTGTNIITKNDPGVQASIYLTAPSDELKDIFVRYKYDGQKGANIFNAVRNKTS